MSSAAVSSDPPSKETPFRASGRFGDVLFSTASLVAAIMIFVVLAFVSAFLIVQAAPALTAPADQISGGKGFWAYVAPIALGTLLASAIALVVATPVAIGVALFISHYAPRNLSKPFGYLIDLLAAIPSVVYGAWGLALFAPLMSNVYGVFGRLVGIEWSATGRTLLTASLVLAIMILPIITSQCREIFIQTPNLHQEAALALGTTKWDMIRAAVFPFARNGIVSAIMLGLGRALGETMAVTMVLSTGGFTWNIFNAGSTTIPAEISLNFPEAFALRKNELIGAGLTLFIITLAVNMLSRWIVSRYSEFSGAN